MEHLFLNMGTTFIRYLYVVVVLTAMACSSSTDGTGDGADVEPGFTDGDAEGQVDNKNCFIDADCKDFFKELNTCEVAVCSLDTKRCVIDQLPVGTSCKDEFLCTGPDYCINGGCGGGPLNCDDQDPCTKDSCDGKIGCVHEPISSEGCDDGNPCTVGDLCVEGQCVGDKNIPGCCIHDAECEDGDICSDDDCQDNSCVHSYNFAPCNDDNTCTVKDHCDGAGSCAGSDIICDDGNPCTADICNPDNGTCETAMAPDGTACEDGNPCTLPDKCQAGKCVGQGSTCQCTTDLDCAVSEDGNLCNGTLKCLDFLCVVDPITVVKCNPTGDTACAKSQCDSQTGQCAFNAVTEGSDCDDQNPCTDTDKCTNGLCIGKNSSCDDNNPCTFDKCSPATGCQYVDNIQPCDDGNLCTVNDQCNAGTCSGVAQKCDDFNGCTSDSCNPATGCTYAPNNLPCDDGNSCTTGDTCTQGLCKPGPNSCQCVTDADCASQEDGDLCNGTLHCVNAKCALNLDTVVKCNTVGDDACLSTVCLPASGACVQKAGQDGAPCNDGNACTLGDVCSSGGCLGKSADCGDGDLCTSDGCDPKTGCWNVANQLPCDDGNNCTGNDKCSGGTCSGVAIGCDDGNECTIDSCDDATGCKSTPVSQAIACDDNNACTVNDLCLSEVCKGSPKNCADGNFCTQDLCNHPQGCSNPPVSDGTPCDDNSACTGGDNCVAGACVGSPPSCDDNDPCTLDTCDSKVGCAYSNSADGTACSDGDPCTAGDGCVSGICVPGASVCGCQTNADCAAEEDGNPCNGTLFCDLDKKCKVDPATVIQCGASANPCTSLVCNTSSGVCDTVDVPNGGVCNDGDDCTGNDTCQNGSCTGLLVGCDDGNPCTADDCSNGKCNYKPAFDGTPCLDDGNACTLDVCFDGKCGSMSLANGLPCVDDGNSCTTDLCQKGQCTHDSVDDGLPCADDGNVCTYDQCTKGICQHISNDPPPIGPNECFPVAELEVGKKETGTWAACGVADQFDFNCSGANCPSTGAISKWGCADPAFVYDGDNTGYEYTYVFVAPVTGICTLVEYNEGIKMKGPGGKGGGSSLFGVVDWFILSGDGACSANKCLEYMWENKSKDPVCGGGNSICSYKSFSVSEGQIFYIVADIFDGVNGHGAYGYNNDWSVEINCDDKQVLLLDEDFSDALCDSCQEKVTASNQCNNFGWHSVGSFGDVVTGYYVGQLTAGTLEGYDCGQTSATVSFPTVTLPNNATSCDLSFDYYADLDAVDDGNCTNDILDVQIAVGGAAATSVSGDPCNANTNSSNPLGANSAPTSKQVNYDLTAFAGSTVTVSLAWSADALNNLGLGVIVDNVRISCTTP